MKRNALWAIHTWISIFLICMVCAVPAVQADPPPATDVVKGSFDGSLFAIYVPQDWNGDLVLYAHGWRPPNYPLELPEDYVYPEDFYIPELRDLLLHDGYAIAYSSYSENGWAVEEGLKETEFLIPLFRSHFVSPNRVYVIGHSMGGLIGVMMAEKHHGKVDGVLSICGTVGGAVMTFDYITNLRVLFDAYFPGVLPPTALDVPDWVDPGGASYVAASYLASDLPAAIEMATVEELGMRWNNVSELINSAWWGLYLSLAATNDLRDRCGGSFFDNSEGYHHPTPGPYILPEDELNAAAEHFTLDQNCYAFLKNWYEPDGDLRIPVLTLHESRDVLVPIEHEQEYASRVAAQGRSGWLVQRPKDAFGHCENFSAAEMKAAFDDLVLWVEDGQTPDVN